MFTSLFSLFHKGYKQADKKTKPNLRLLLISICPTLQEGASPVNAFQRQGCRLASTPITGGRYENVYFNSLKKIPQIIKKPVFSRSYKKNRKHPSPKSGFMLCPPGCQGLAVRKEALGGEMATKKRCLCLSVSHMAVSLNWISYVCMYVCLLFGQNTTEGVTWRTIHSVRSAHNYSETI